MQRLRRAAGVRSVVSENLGGAAGAPPIFRCPRRILRRGGSIRLCKKQRVCCACKNPRTRPFGGALILILANLLVKVIGAVFKIPLTNLVGEEAMGLFHVAYNLYNAMFVLSTAGLPVAVSKWCPRPTPWGAAGRSAGL